MIEKTTGNVSGGFEMVPASSGTIEAAGLQASVESLAGQEG